MENRLLRNEHDKVIAGVSSGLASYMQVDVTIIRLLFVLSTIFLVGTGILVYLVMWIVVPVNDDPAAKFNKFNDYFKKQNQTGFNTPPPFGQANPFHMGSATGTSGETGPKTAPAGNWNNPEDPKVMPKNSDTGRMVGGLFLLVIGLYFLMNEFNFIPYWFEIGRLWPLVFVAIGLSFILKSKRKNDWENLKTQQDESAAANTADKNAPAEDHSASFTAPNVDYTAPKTSGIDLEKNKETGEQR